MTRRRHVTPDERRLWWAAMRGTEPIAGRASLPEPPAPPPVPPSPAPESVTAANDPAVPATVKPTSRAGRVGDRDAVPGRDLDRRTGDRLRRGKLPIDGRIDLHGRNQAEAHAVLGAFIHRAWAEGRRCVLVITGKGSWTPGGGVLRRMVPRWLAEPALAGLVLAIESARPADGGDGALYVLVRRRRPADDGRSGGGRGGGER